MVKTVGAKDTKQRNRSTKAQMEMKRLKDKGFATTRQGFIGLFQAAQSTEAAGPSEGSSSTPNGDPEGEVPPKEWLRLRCVRAALSLPLGGISPE